MLAPMLRRVRAPPTRPLAVLFSLSIFAALLLFWHVLSDSGPTRLFGHAPSGKKTEFGSEGRHIVKSKYWTVSGDGAFEGLSKWTKPKSLNKIVGLIFYGRPATVSILDCYLKRNLVKNGGMLDEVIWIVRTNSSQDVAWLDVLLSTESDYKKWDVKFNDTGDYRSAYDRVENGTMYIKIDDDIVFMEDSTIPTIAHAKIAHPEWFVVSANIMNQPTLSWVHHHLGAVKPYLPELQPQNPPMDVPQKLHLEWRASKLPDWSGPADFNMTLDWEPAFTKHRWLPVRPESNRTIDDTPIAHTEYDAFGKGLKHWTVAAQEHYSFFENLEKNELYMYKFHHWDYQYVRLGIQFMAIMGDDINLSKPIPHRDDEYFFSEVMPKKTKRHAVVDGRAIAAHYSFAPQVKGMHKTDVLERYKTFAQENICVSPLT